MSFEVIFDEGMQYIKVFYSTKETRKGKYFGEFYKKMDALSSEVKRLKQQLDADRESAEEIFKDAGNDALSERFKSGRYRFDDDQWYEDMIVSEDLLDKKNEMQLLAEEIFNKEVLVDEEGADEYKWHNEYGSIYLDDDEEQQEIALSQYFENEEYFDEWYGEKKEKLEKQDWYIIWTKSVDGRYKTEGSGKHEGDRFMNFSEKYIDWVDGLFQYDGLPLTVPAKDEEVHSDEVELYFGDDTSANLKIQSKREQSRVQLGEGFMYPDEKKYCFMKRSAADVDISYEGGSDGFTFTPCFGEFKDEFSDLQKYLVNYVKEKKLDWCDVEVEWLRHCHYEINPETKELGEFLESSGIECDSWEWNPKTQEFDDVPDDDDDEEEEEE